MKNEQLESNAKKEGFTPPFVESNSLERRTGFTLLELMVVIVIIGILATLGFPRYGAYREQTLDREAQANLRLILAAERIYRMETGLYLATSGAAQPAPINEINANLRLLLTAAASRSWNYITQADNTATPPTSCAQATRVSDARTWRMRNTEDDPQSAATCP